MRRSRLPTFSGLTQQYADMVDGMIEAEPLVATVNITVGPDQGTQSPPPSQERSTS